MLSMMSLGSCSVRNLYNSFSTNSWFFSNHFWASTKASCPSFFKISKVAKPTCLANSLASLMISLALAANLGMMSCMTTWTLALTGAMIALILSFNSSNSSEILSANFSPVAFTFSTALSMAFPTFSQKSVQPYGATSVWYPLLNHKSFNFFRMKARSQVLASSLISWMISS